MSYSVLSKLSWAEWIVVILGRGVINSAKVICLLAFGMLGLQPLIYLRTGEWPDWSVFNVLSGAFPVPFMDWLLYPKDWIGLHKIVSWCVLNCPIYLFTLLVAGVWLIVGMAILGPLFQLVDQGNIEEV